MIGQVIFTALVTMSCSRGGAVRVACPPVAPERIIGEPVDVGDLAPVLPPALRGDVTVDGGAITVRRGTDEVVLTSRRRSVDLRAWADLDGDGRDDLIVDDGDPWVVNGRTTGRHDVADVGVRIRPEQVNPWWGDLDGRPGGDLTVPHRDATSAWTDVYSISDVTKPVKRLPGLPRVLLDTETIMFDPGPPSTLTFVPGRRPALRVDLGASQRVEWVRVFDEGGVRKVALTIDRRTAIWPVPRPCR